jgi:DNA-binding HxlR family transcriptional regulator
MRMSVLPDAISAIGQRSIRPTCVERPKNELAPRRGQALTERMADYGQFCPVSRGAEIFAERWTPLILRELLNGSHRFSEIQLGLPRVSRNLLTQRLVSLAGAGVIERRPAERGRGFAYYLTPAGEELRPVVEALGAWGYRWGGTDLPSDELDPVLLMWFIRRRVQIRALRRARTVIRFDFRRPRRSFWLRIEPPAVDLCFTDEGFDIALAVDADLAALTAVWLGRTGLAEAIAAGSVRLEGDEDAGPLFVRWFGLSPFAAGGAERILLRAGAGSASTTPYPAHEDAAGSSASRSRVVR